MRRRPDRPSPRAVLLGIAVGIAALSVGVGLVALPETSGPPPAQEVELPSPPSDESAVDGADEPAFSSPEPVQCQPFGCERWRRSLPALGTTVVAGPDELLVVRTGYVLQGVDATSGTTSWTAALASSASSATSEVPVDVAAGHDLVAAGGEPGWVQAREAADGALRWRAQAEHDVLSIAVVGDGVVLAAGPPPARDSAERQPLTAFDARDGRVRWEQGVHRLLAAQDHQVLASVGALTHALDPATGATLFATPGRAVPLGPWLAVDDGTDTRLLDPIDGTPLTVLHGIAYAGPVRAGDTWIVVMARPPRAWATDFSPTAIGLDADGTVRWEQDLAGDAGACCAVMVAPTGAVVVEPGARGAALVLDDDSGEVVEMLVPPPLGAPELGPAADLWVGERDGTLNIVGAEGSARVRGGAAVASEQPLVVAGDRQLVGVQLAGPGLEASDAIPVGSIVGTGRFAPAVGGDQLVEP